MRSMTELSQFLRIFLPTHKYIRMESSGWNGSKMLKAKFAESKYSIAKSNSVAINHSI